MTLEIEYINVPVDSITDVPKAINCNESVGKIVTEKMFAFKTINISETMKQLSSVGELLRVANAASYGVSSSVILKEILSNYQTLLGHTSITTSEFVLKCIDSINLHKRALKFVERKRFADGLKLIAETAELAKKMAETSEKLVTLSENLVNLATKALLHTEGNHLELIKEQKEIQKKKDEMEAQATSLESELDSLRSQIKEMKELADDARDQAAEDRKMSNILRIVGAITSPLAQLAGPIISSYGNPAGTIMNKVAENFDKNIINRNPTKEEDATIKVTKEKKKLNKESKEKKEELTQLKNKKKELEAKKIKGTISEDEKSDLAKVEDRIKLVEKALKELGDNISKVSDKIASELIQRANACEDREMEYRKLKNNYQDLERNTNTNLVKSLKLLETFSKNDLGLEVSIKSLEIAITTLGKIRTIFENTKLFWVNVQAQCERLSKIGEIQDAFDFAKDGNKEDLIELENEIKKSGLSWLALANINYIAFDAIGSVKTKFDDVMSNLPNKEESLQIVSECSKEIGKLLEKENQIIDDTKKRLAEIKANRAA